ncbi:MAG: YpdA family putative bacillithiol disulfide reductase [Acidobacteria bacterium]|nr:MAG: YpdA family putative bacillithiol disulfide reductase [Acidobacteriota bacterium]
MADTNEVLDLLIVGAGPTGIAIGAEARKAGLGILLVDRGPLVGNLLGFPTYMSFFTTRDLLEIADVPFAIPEDKPTRRQALVYYQAVATKYRLPLALREEVTRVRREGELFEVETSKGDKPRLRSARAVALATGYFHNPRRLGVPGEDLPWVRGRYREPYEHYGDRVAVIGGGNTAVETALDLWRNGAEVTLVHRGSQVRGSVKYWLKPDLENRIDEGSIAARFDSQVVGFEPGGIELRGPQGSERLPADFAYVLIGYTPDVSLQERCGVEIDAETLVPSFDPDTCESNVPGLYVAGTLQAGARTDQIFIENSRDHGARIVHHLVHRLGLSGTPSPVGTVDS